MVHTFKYQTIGSNKHPRPFIPLTLRYNSWSGILLAATEDDSKGKVK